MKIKIAQLLTSRNISENKAKVLSILDTAQENEWVIFPEGMLSGYYPDDPEYLNNMDKLSLTNAEVEIKNLIVAKKCHCIFGTILFEGNKSFNSSVYFNWKGNEFVYRKNNLSTLDRKHFEQGDRLDIFSVDDLIFGVQMCRENAFPEQWKVLKRKKAKVVFHINNAVREDDLIRKYLLIARAFENQYYVCSVNTFTKAGPLPSLLIDPDGRIIYEAPLHKEDVSVHEIDLNATKDIYLQQERKDLVDIKF